MSDPAADVSQRVLVALRRAKARIAELEARQQSPIAIVGMSCRVPGGANPESFWTTLLARGDMIREIPEDRLIGPWPEQVPRWAGLLDDVAGFDAGFFGVSAVEATAMDPQQRMLLELTWAALEHARMIPARLRGSKTGVFVGSTGSEYLDRVARRHPEDRTAYDVTGVMPSVASGRIAYAFGFHGPAVSLDTACSSSLVAIHLACQSLRDGGCDLALAGGVKVVASEQYLEFVALTQGLSSDGRCKTFDSRANGFVLGEGAGLVVLKRLADAERDGDPILGIIRGSAINQDGRSTSLTAPNVIAQEAVLRDALQNAGVESADIDYVECHGTGTALGDPIEVDAIKSVFGGAGAAPLWLGAVKTNIGHLEAAAGVAGLIKVLLAFRHEHLPANLHLRHLNPRIKLGATRLKLLSEASAWRRDPARRRIAGVSSFGMSGTNSHVVVEEGRALEGPTAAERPRVEFPTPVLLSARSEAALQGQARTLLRHLELHPEIDRVDLGFSLSTTRTHFEHRAAIVGADLRSELDDLAVRGRLARAEVATARNLAKVGLLFTGQGAQRLGMGKAIHAAFPRFRAAFDQISACFDAHLDRRLSEVVFGQDATALDQTAYTQPALFCLEVALHALLESWGVGPSALLGHSIGELAAAHVAGVFSLADACRLVAARGRLMQALPGGGAMVSIQASEHEVRALLGTFTGVEIAGLNGPLSVVISGDEAATLAAAEQMRARGRKVKRLVVSHAFHSHHMDPMLAEFEAIARTIEYAPPRIPVVSNVSGRIAEPGELTDPRYWVRQVREPVRFLDGIRTLEGLGVNVLLELGPHGVLSAMAAACVAQDSNTPPFVVAALARDDESTALVSALGALHCQGVAVDWPEFFAASAPRVIELPTYAFQHSRYWIEVSERRSAPSIGLLGPRIASPLASVQFQCLLDPRRLTLQSVVNPGKLHAGVVLGMVSQAARSLWTAAIAEFSVTFEGELTVDSDAVARLQLVVDPPGPEGAEYRVYAELGEDDWYSIARGRVRVGAPAARGEGSEGASSSSVELRALPADLESQLVHPAGLDELVQRVVEAHQGGGPVRQRVMACARIRVHASLPARFGVEASAEAGPTGDLRLEGVVRRPDGGLVLEFEGLEVRVLGPLEAAIEEPSEAIEARIIAIVERTLNVLPGLDDDIGNDYGVDSLSLIAFMAAMQKEFGVSLQQIFRTQSFSVRSLAKVVRGDSEEGALAIDFSTPLAPVETRRGEPETFPGHDLGPLEVSFGAVKDLFEFELVGFGAGDPILFLPPFNSEWPIWLPTMIELAARHRVIGVNYPGLGRCKGASGLRDISQLAAWLAWTLDALGLQRLTVAGWSLGGFVAQKLACERPDLVARLILVNTTAKLGTSETAAGAAELVTRLNAHLESELASLPNERREQLAGLVAHGSEGRKFEFGYYKALTNWDSRDLLSTIHQPTMIVTGKHDPLTPPEHGEELHRSIRGSIYDVVESGHYVPLFAVDTLVAKIAAFLAARE